LPKKSPSNDEIYELKCRPEFEHVMCALI